MEWRAEASLQSARNLAFTLLFLYLSRELSVASDTSFARTPKHPKKIIPGTIFRLPATWEDEAIHDEGKEKTT